MKNVRVDVKIMGVQSRLVHIKRLKDSLGLTWDDCVIDDRGINGGGDAWYNAKRAWRAPTAEGATHRLVLQDDALVCKGFLDAVLKAARKFPDAAWSFYNKHTITVSKAYDSPYFRQNGGQTGGVALMLPIEHIEPMIAWSDSIFGKDYKHDDSRFGWYCQANDVPFMGLVPSLTDHKPVESTIPHHSDKRRRAGNFAVDASLIDLDADGVNCSGWCLPYIWLNEKSPYWNRAQAMASKVKEAHKHARTKKEQLK